MSKTIIYLIPEEESNQVAVVDQIKYLLGEKKIDRVYVESLPLLDYQMTPLLSSAIPRYESLDNVPENHFARMLELEKIAIYGTNIGDFAKNQPNPAYQANTTIFLATTSPYKEGQTQNYAIVASKSSFEAMKLQIKEAELTDKIQFIECVL